MTQGNELDKAACQQRLDGASISSPKQIQQIQLVTSTVDTKVMLETLEQKFPECKNGNCFHLFYHCKEMKCMLNEPVFISSLKGVA